jgi:hypothetical protein
MEETSTALLVWSHTRRQNWSPQHRKKKDKTRTINIVLITRNLHIRRDTSWSGSYHVTGSWPVGHLERNKEAKKKRNNDEYERKR